jgi:hypothetical protein
VVDRQPEGSPGFKGQEGKVEHEVEEYESVPARVWCEGCDFVAESLYRRRCRRGGISVSSLHLCKNESLERVRGVVKRKNFVRLKIARGRDLGGGLTGLLRYW